MSAPTPQAVTRPKRFPLRMPLRYRRAGTHNWHTGTSENVSCSGVLFRCRKALRPLEAVDVEMELPRELTGEAPLTVICHGYVARVVEYKTPIPRAAVAAAFLDYEVKVPHPEAKPHADKPEDATRHLRHAINNLLAAVIGNAELILTDANATQLIRDCAQRILEAGERAATEVKKSA